MDPVRVSRWDELDLERITEMVSRKRLCTDAYVMAQVYLKRGALIPRHRHGVEQLIYVLQGAVRARVGDAGEAERVVREGEVLAVPAGVPHQAEALDDTFVLSVHAAEVVGTR